MLNIVNGHLLTWRKYISSSCLKFTRVRRAVFSLAAQNSKLNLMQLVKKRYEIWKISYKPKRNDHTCIVRLESQSTIWQILCCIHWRIKLGSSNYARLYDFNFAEEDFNRLKASPGWFACFSTFSDTTTKTIYREPPRQYDFKQVSVVHAKLEFIRP